MRRFVPRVPSSLFVVLFLVALTASSSVVLAKSHTWRIEEVFSNPDGTIQFIELQESAGLNDEQFVPGHILQSSATTRTFTVPGAALPATTAFKHLLFATPGFSSLPGAPTPDYTFTAGVPWFGLVSDTISCTGWPSFIFTAGQLPTDGIHSLICTNASGCTSVQFTVGVNSPTNYAGQTGSVDASAPPPAVPDGSAGSTPMLAGKLDAAGSQLSITFDTATCSGTTNRQIIYGVGSQLPTSLGGTFGLTGSACAIGTSPFSWTTVPDATGLVWWLITAKDASGREGSWGKSSAGLERIGPAVDGSSAQCGVTTRNLANACGH